MGPSKDRTISFHVMNEATPDTDRIREMPAHLAVHTGRHPIPGIKRLVEVVEQVCKSGKARIDDFTIVAHGNDRGAWIGKDWLSLATVKRHEADLARLAGLFDGATSTCTIHTREPNFDTLLLSHLSQLWGGVRVYGYLERYYRVIFKPLDLEWSRVCTLRLAGITVQDQEH